MFKTGQCLTQTKHVNYYFFKALIIYMNHIFTHHFLLYIKCVKIKTVVTLTFFFTFFSENINGNVPSQ